MQVNQLNDQGITLVEVIVSVVMLAVLIAGIGYMTHSVVPVQRSYHAQQVDTDALKLSLLLTTNIERASEIVSPAEPVGNSTSSSSDLILTTFIWDETAGFYREGYVHFRYGSSGIFWCSTTTAASCSPVEPILSSWDNGEVKAESGTQFLRGIDVDGNGTLSERESHYVRTELVLSQNEGPSTARSRIHNRIYYLEKLANVDNVRNLN